MLTCHLPVRGCELSSPAEEERLSTGDVVCCRWVEDGFRGGTVGKMVRKMVNMKRKKPDLLTKSHVENGHVFPSWDFWDSLSFLSREGSGFLVNCGIRSPPMKRQF